MSHREIREHFEALRGRDVLQVMLLWMALIAGAGVLTFLTGCAPTIQRFSADGSPLAPMTVSDVAKIGVHQGGYVQVQKYPWQAPVGAWLYNPDGEPQFYLPSTAAQSALSSFSGPLQSLVGDIQPSMMIPTW